MKGEFRKRKQQSKYNYLLLSINFTLRKDILLMYQKYLSNTVIMFLCIISMKILVLRHLSVMQAITQT